MPVGAHMAMYEENGSVKRHIKKINKGIGLKYALFHRETTPATKAAATYSC